MHRTRIKICGVCRPEDARTASAAGADAVGMIFHPASRRNISLDRAGQVVRAVGPFVTPVAVFVDAAMETIRDTIEALGLRVVQLHGRETPEQVEQVGRLGVKVLKAVRVNESLEQELATWRRFVRQADGIIVSLVLETAATGQAGGSGVPNDFAAIQRCQERGLFEGLPPIVAAGGLSPETVGQVVRTIRPWAVDVSSGVEEDIGQKSPSRIADFIRAVREAE